MLETEVKFSVHGSFVIPDLSEGSVAASIEQLPDQDLKASYYDTPDLRLARSGVTLRYRAGDDDVPGWHLKLPVADGDGRTREELQFDGEPRAVPSMVEDLVTVFVRTQKVAPVESIHTRRRRWLLNDPEGEPLAELVDDEVSVMQRGRVITRFRELELEKHNADPTSFERIIDELQSAGAQELEPIPKVVRVLGPGATAPSDLPEIPELDGSATGADLVRHALARGLHRLVQHDPRTRRGDVEGVHQMRVAARRMRSDLRTFDVLVDAKWAQELVDELRWLGDELGRVRDLDVLRERLEHDAAGASVPLIPLFNRLSDEHERAREQMQDALRSDRYKILLDRLIRAAQTPILTTSAERGMNVLGPMLVAQTWRKLRKAARDIDDDSPDDHLHRVRIKAKRARYAAEAVAPALPGGKRKAALRFASRAERLQEVLGELQDATVAQETILSCLKVAGKDPSLHFEAGRLFEKQRHLAARSRASFEPAWRKIDRRKSLSWLSGGG